MKSVSALPVKYLLNTHHHTDHAGGDAVFINTTEIIAHRNVRENFLRNKQPGAPRVTFNDQVSVFLGGVEVRAYYFGRGHTNGDAVIYFPDLKVIHSGDLITEGMPVLDYNNGASAVEWVKALDEILKLDFDIVIPGHGALLNKDRIRSDRQKLVTMNQRMAELARKGVPLEQVFDQLKLADLDGSHGQPEAFKGGLKGYYEEMKNDNEIHPASRHRGRARDGHGRDAGPATSEGHAQLPDAQWRLVAALHRQGRRLLREAGARRDARVRRPPGRHRDGRERPGADEQLQPRIGDAGELQGRAVRRRRRLVNEAYFALMTRKDVASVTDLKGKTFAVSQIGDPPYNYTSAFFQKFGMTPRDVQWIAAGADAKGRAAALSAGRADATLLTPPAYFRLEEAGFKSLGNLADHDDIFAATTYLMKKTTIAAKPAAAGTVDRAHAEAIKRFYDDKAFAVKAYQAYDKQTDADVERLYDGYAKANVLERVPYVLRRALQAVIDQQVTPSWRHR